MAPTPKHATTIRFQLMTRGPELHRHPILPQNTAGQTSQSAKEATSRGRPPPFPLLPSFRAPSPYRESGNVSAHGPARSRGVRRAMAFLFGAALGLVLGVVVVMVFARLENARAEQRRELVRACRQWTGLIPHQFF
jgi:hypothetical protein